MNSFFFFFLFLIDFRVSLCADDSRYWNCFRGFECGNIKDITYPFWGNGRPDYCGKPDFELKCKDDEVEIKIGQQIYKVWNIDQERQEIYMSSNETCESRFVNTSLPPGHFFRSDSTAYLNLFYACPSIPQLISNRFNCSMNESSITNSNNYFWTDYLTRKPYPRDLQRCNVSVTVIVSESYVKEIEYIGWSPSKILSFHVTYVDIYQYICDDCKRSGGQCGRDLNSSSPQPICFCSHGLPYQERCPAAATRDHVWMMVGIGAAAILGILIIPATIVIFYGLRRKLSTKAKLKNVETFLKYHKSLAPKRYKYSAVRQMTGSFQDKLGQGGYGGVFKGTLPNGRTVAVKVLNETKCNGDEFINEVASITRTSHVNIVTLLGFCVDGPKRALIYEFMPNGSLEKFIYIEKPLETHPHLGWETLYKIAIGIARGLEYLHRGCYTRILHFDIKPHNILLDKDFSPKISDFGLAKLSVGKESIVTMTRARGTPGYIAPEVGNRNFGGVSYKADVYSYGMMVLEMVGGRKNIDVKVSNISEIYFPHWIYKRIDLNEDLGLYGVTTIKEEEIARKMILVGMWCIQIDPVNRPPMNKVLEMLEGSLDALRIPPKPFLSTPTRSRDHSPTTSIS